MDNKTILENLNNDTMYDFISNNYYKMNSTELKDILIEYIYTLETTLFDKIKDNNNNVVVLDKNDIQDIKNELIENIKYRIE